MEVFSSGLSRIISDRKNSVAAWYTTNGTHCYFPKPCFDRVHVLSTVKTLTDWGTEEHERVEMDLWTKRLAMDLQNLLVVRRSSVVVALVPDEFFMVFPLQAVSPTPYTTSSFFDALTLGFSFECHAD